MIRKMNILDIMNIKTIFSITCVVFIFLVIVMHIPLVLVSIGLGNIVNHNIYCFILSLCLYFIYKPFEILFIRINKYNWDIFCFFYINPKLLRELPIVSGLKCVVCKKYVHIYICVCNCSQHPYEKPAMTWYFIQFVNITPCKNLSRVC